MSRSRKLKIDAMILASFVSTCFYAATYPFIHRVIMTQATDNIVAIEQILSCLGTILSGFIWNKWSKKLFPFYPLFCILETITDVSCTIYALATGNLVAYYILATICFSLVTRNMICGGNRLRILRYQDETAREHFQNNDNSARSAATIIGSVIAMRLNLSFPVMIWLATIGNALDNIFYLVIYYQTTKTTK